jgi:NAD(P)H dehydrogenase (quinone)
MADAPAIAVTGATGRLGGLIAGRLAAIGVPQILVVRDPSRAPRLPGAQVRVAEYGDDAAVRVALKQVDTVVMVSLPAAEDRLPPQVTFIDAARRAGVRHVVYISFVGAGPQATFTHARLHGATERHLRESGLEFTFLRNSLYADLLLDTANAGGAIRGPAGRGRVSPVARADAADVAAAIARRPAEHSGAVYDVTGPHALTLAEIASQIGLATGQAVAYVDESLPQAYASRAIYRAPAWQVEGWVSSYRAIAAGELDTVSDAVPHIAGHPALTLAELAAGPPLLDGTAGQLLSFT